MKNTTLAPQELAIMKIVWRAKAATVRDVYKKLCETREIAYTTVMTMMNVLEIKGFLKKEPEGRAYRYHPTRPQRVVITAMVREFVDRVFDGASQPLLVHLVQDRRLSDAERDELRRLLRE